MLQEQRRDWGNKSEAEDEKTPEKINKSYLNVLKYFLSKILNRSIDITHAEKLLLLRARGKEVLSCGSSSSSRRSGTGEPSEAVSGGRLRWESCIAAVCWCWSATKAKWNVLRK